MAAGILLSPTHGHPEPQPENYRDACISTANFS
jgi:hypothetical protein